jgi:hypothetical protein
MTGEEEYQKAMAEKAPFLYCGTRYLWVWNPSLGEHRYLNLDTDMIEHFPPFLD